jgi:short-subunit dehydrogenase
MAASNEFLNKYGPTALVTGASSGIGKSFAELLAAKGFNLVLVARRLQQLEELASRLEAKCSIKVTICQADLGDDGAVRQILEATSELDIGLVVSNAGYGLKGDHAGHRPGDLTAMLMVNCNTPMLLANGFAPRLRARGKGGIIFTSSVEALLGMPYSAAYSATKGFVNRLSEALWGELTSDGIDVLAVCPGATATDALRRAGMDPATLPNVMSPDEVANLALDNVANGPVFLPSPHYEAMFKQLLAMPPRDALSAMAVSMKK